MIQKINPLPAFNKITQEHICLVLTPYTELVFENMRLSYLAQNHSSVTRLKQFCL